MSDAVRRLCLDALARPGLVTFLTGAGISAESGIPTFRGAEGYWTIGSTEYRPQELATRAAFRRMPWGVWAWYLYRRGVCRGAQPNDAHRALARAEQALGDRVLVVTQNVDGLHRRAGSSPARTYEIHGNIELMRCAAACTAERWPIPDGVPDLARGDDVPEAAQALLVCPRCGAMARPHVLWFDESYDEELFRWDSSQTAAERTSLLVVVGTSARTNLPWVVVELAERRGATILDVNVEDNPFGAIAERRGAALREPAAVAIPALVEHLIGA
jgi:NAD-dependent deacetylase